jgi:hypothetical protein
VTYFRTLATRHRFRTLATRHRVRQVVNLVNGSTVAGRGIALAGDARLARGPQGLLTATGYRPPVPVAPAFTVGNVIIVTCRWRGPVPLEASAPRIFAHEARHATQYAWCGGLLMLPLYFAAAGASWAACGDFAAWNAFERQAGLADGGYTDRPLRPALTRALSKAKTLTVIVAPH